MKKSFDYFKTLKELSRINSLVFSSVALGEDFKKHTVTFYGLRFELLQRLSDDFVAPIERNDIYNLTYDLYNQFCNIIILGDISDGSLSLSNEHLSEFKLLFTIQSDIMLGFSKKSEYSSYLKLCRQGQQQVLALKRSILSVMLKDLRSSIQPLYRCVVFNAVLDFCDKLSEALCHCERIIINNI